MIGKDDQIRLVPLVKIAVNHMEPEVEWIEGRLENPFSEDPLKDLWDILIQKDTQYKLIRQKVIKKDRHFLPE